MVVKQVDITRVHTEAVVIAPPVAPTRRAFLPDAGRPAPRPVAQVTQRPVVARREPPPRPAPVAARASFLQQHAGQPFNYREMHQAIAPQAKPATVIVRPGPATRPVAVHPGEHVGNAPAAERHPEQPAARPMPENRAAPRNVHPQPYERPQPVQQERREQPHIAPQQQHAAPPQQVHERPRPAQVQSHEQPHPAPSPAQHEEHRANQEHKDDHKDKDHPH